MQLTPDLIKQCVKAYREERNRTESEARRRRATLDKEYARAKASAVKLRKSANRMLIVLAA